MSLKHPAGFVFLVFIKLKPVIFHKMKKVINYVRNICVIFFKLKKKFVFLQLKKYPVVTERLREKCVAHKCRLRRTIFLPFWYV